jgi:hypothetical protein
MTFSRFTVLALFCALVCFSGVGAPSDLGDPMQDAARPHGDRSDRAWKRYRNSDLGYCVSYPSRWFKGEAFDGTGLFVKTAVNRSLRSVGEIDVGPMNTPAPEDARLEPASFTPETLDHDLQEHIEGLQKFVRAEKLEVLARRHLKVQGFDALYAKDQYYDPLERSKWMEEVVFVERRGELYRLELQCPPDQISRFEPVFAYLVNTLEFDCK